jgi:hypothetical protein
MEEILLEACAIEGQFSPNEAFCSKARVDDASRIGNDRRQV